MPPRRASEPPERLDLTTHVCDPSPHRAFTIDNDIVVALTGAFAAQHSRGLNRAALELLARVAEAFELPQPAQVDCVLCCGERIRCVNCDGPIEAPRPFCSEACQQQGHLIRYLRRAIPDGRVFADDVLEAIGTRLVILFGGGYSARARRLSRERRGEIFARDRRVCQLCGRPGAEIDHIDGSSDDLTNLRVLCTACNRGRVEGALRVVTPESDPELYEYIESLVDGTARRVAAALPVRFFDDEVGWGAGWRDVQRRLRARWALEPPL